MQARITYTTGRTDLKGIKPVGGLTDKPSASAVSKQIAGNSTPIEADYRAVCGANPLPVLYVN
jgi:hypothetical protein